MTSISEVLKVMRRKKEQGINLSYKGTWRLEQVSYCSIEVYFSTLLVRSLSTNASSAHTSTQTETVFAYRSL